MAEGLEQDIQMRQAIIESMLDATISQVGVYVSSWKYSPCLSPSLLSIFESTLSSEL